MSVQPSLFDVLVVPLFEQSRGDWIEQARAAARTIARRKGEVTINDVREVCPPPENMDPRVMGAVMRQPEFQVVRYERSTRSVCHNRPVAVFRLGDTA